MGNELFHLFSYVSLAEVDPCKLPIQRGMCLAYIPQWAMNAETGKCVPFIYGGCGGNANRFETREKCEMACMAKKFPLNIFI